MRCQSTYQNWTATGKNGVIRQCTREEGHPVIEVVKECEPYRTVTTGECKTSFTFLEEGHQWLRRGHAVKWPDRAAMPRGE